MIQSLIQLNKQVTMHLSIKNYNFKKVKNKIETNWNNLIFLGRCQNWISSFDRFNLINHFPVVGN